jgi:RES domain-containing protein
MVQVWRLVKEKYAESAFSGDGARQAGGRFNSPGQPVVYTSESLALAELEILVHLPTSHLLDTYVAFRASLPKTSVESLDREAPPDDWRANPVPRGVQAVGDEWLQSGRSLALRVPSAVVPAEENVLVNPEHSDIEAVEVDGPFDPKADDRLL